MLFWILLLILVIVVYAILMIFVLPEFILKSKYPEARTTDRGLKKYKFNDSDYAIVYEPSLTARKYISQYVLAKRDGKKTIKCKIAPNVTYIDFDILLFDAEETCFLVINSMDIVGADGLGNEIELPNETSYASIVVNQVNEREMRKTQFTRVSGSHLFMFGVLSLICSVAMSIGVLFAFSNIFGGLFRETFAEKMLSSGWIFMLPTLISAACITSACCTLFSRNSKR